MSIHPTNERTNERTNHATRRKYTRRCGLPTINIDVNDTQRTTYVWILVPFAPHSKNIDTQSRHILRISPIENPLWLLWLLLYTGSSEITTVWRSWYGLSTWCQLCCAIDPYENRYDSKRLHFSVRRYS